MSSPEQRSDPVGRGGVSRRSVMRTAAWSAPVVAIAVAAPAAAASGENPTFVAIGPDAGDEFKTFGIQMSDLPALPAGAVDEYLGLIVDFCLPEGFQVLSVVTAGWGFVNFGEDYEGGGAFVFNTVAIPAGDDALVQVVIEKDPDLGPLSGTMVADVILGDLAFPIFPLSWEFEYGPNPVWVSCESPLRRR